MITEMFVFRDLVILALPWFGFVVYNQPS